MSGRITSRTRTHAGTQARPDAAHARANVSSSSSLLLQRKCACGKNNAGGGACGKCSDSEKRVRRRVARAGEVSHGASASGAVGDVLRSHGSPLDASTRTFMESRFGHDFSGVRVHTDARAHESTRALNALAYTVGSHIAFGAGQYAPASVEGRRLIAHELTHVVQQSSSNSALSAKSDGVTAEDSASEREADAAADSVISNETVPALSPLRAGVVSRKAAGRDTAAGGTECPQTFVIPDDVYEGIVKAWEQSGHGKAKQIEHGGRIVTDRHGKPVIRTGAGTESGMDPKNRKHYPRERGDVTRGSFHTHPYGKGSAMQEATFSGGDVNTFIENVLGPVMYVGSAECFFVLNTVNAALRRTCRRPGIEDHFADVYNATRGNIPRRGDTAVADAVNRCGVCYYKTCRRNDGSLPPKTANLVEVVRQK